ncbi:hypothetical protein [Microvirga lotononidis]|uniref:Uncharacterized protein n=1 Tax=Microvirga lotononidis TaxID=864069 RepID=I4YZW4_9HYPH|nr:hypothetical protein [Microvirga lotononidis]EIM29506.1 hypothetical protein MicloDRAFT_00019870 [Microvirga lotononidis]WQO27181.1 hypothetical protein U0023_21420 [Microvirga lotononidis]
MRAILALLCLFSGLPDDTPAEGFDATQEKTERYRAFLSELASWDTSPSIETATDLPEGLKQAVEAWTGSRQ